jgi:hypothetical protein
MDATKKLQEPESERCWATHPGGHRCNLRAGHEGDHRSVISWPDIFSDSPEDGPDNDEQPSEDTSTKTPKISRLGDRRAAEGGF